MFRRIIDFLIQLFRDAAYPVPEPVPDSPPVPTPEPAPVPDSPPAPVPEAPKETDYIPWSTRAAWAGRMEYCYSVWRGHRDLQVLLSHPETHERFDVDETILRRDITDMTVFHNEQNVLVTRIMDSRHPDFYSRSRVRKSVALAVIAEGESWTRVYDQYKTKMEAAGVVFGVNYDSIKGYFERG